MFMQWCLVIGVLLVVIGLTDTLRRRLLSAPRRSTCCAATRPKGPNVDRVCRALDTECCVRTPPALETESVSGITTSSFIEL
jgi:hypothetical protein